MSSDKVEPDFVNFNVVTDVVEDVSSELSDTANRKRPVDFTTFSIATMRESVREVVDSKAFQSVAEETILMYEHQRNVNIIKKRSDLVLQRTSEGVFVLPLLTQHHYTNLFTKGLKHDSDGIVQRSEMSTFLRALKKRDLALLPHDRYVNPSAAWSSDIVGSNNNTYTYSKPPLLSSEKLAVSMVLLYSMQLCRDVQFTEYHTHPLINDCCDYLNMIPRNVFQNGKISHRNIFRGPLYGCTQGNIISYFINNKSYDTYSSYNYLETWKDAITAQSSVATRVGPEIIKKTISCGRDLASILDSTDIITHIMDCMLMLEQDRTPHNFKNNLEVSYTTWGFADITATTLLVVRNALSVASYMKWNTLVLRPERYAIEVERVFRTKINAHSIPSILLKNDIIGTLCNNENRGGICILSQVYPDGAPLSPSSPSEHAVAIGAAVTVWKFFYDTEHILQIPHTINGETVILKASVSDELHKWAFNLGLGDCWAGVHFYNDIITGLKLGERVALNCLGDLIHKYPGEVAVKVRRFNDKVVVISK